MTSSVEASRNSLQKTFSTSFTTESSKSTLQKTFDLIQPFWIGGLSGIMATCVIQPVDMIKVVIQLKSEAYSKLKNPTKVTFGLAMR
jgi:hypothetical protein